MDRFSSKILLFGEYSVLYNSMALTIPFKEFGGNFSYEKTIHNKEQAERSNQGLRSFCNHMLEYFGDDTFKVNVDKFKQELDKGLFFDSNIPQGFGLGSSGALVAAFFLRYLDKAGDFKDELKVLSKERIRGLKTTLGKMEGYFHGSSSGIDPLSILINEPLLMKSSTDVSPVQLPTYKEDGKNVVFLLNTGMPRDTEPLVAQFKAACETRSFQEKLENQLTVYTNKGITNFLNKETDSMYTNLYSLIDFQLREMNYIFPEAYAKLAHQGISTGDYFLKVCGAGGGGFMLGFTENWDKTQEKLAGQNLEAIYRY